MVRNTRPDPNSTMKQALNMDRDERTSRITRNSMPTITNTVVGYAGDPLEVANHVLHDDPHNEAGLASFLPPSLKFLNDVLPFKLHYIKPPDFLKNLGLSAGPTTAQSVVTELQRMRTDAPDSIHTLAFLAGILLVCGACYNFVIKIMALSPLHTFFAIMMILFGLMVLVMEQQRAIFKPKYRLFIEKYFLFMTLITGRGCFMIYVGAIQAAVNWKVSSLNVLVGLFMLFVGFTYVRAGWSVSTKLNHLTANLHSRETIEAAFKKADIDESGELDHEELVIIMGILGSTLTPQEAETAVMMLDEDKSGAVSLGEFIKFMERDDASKVIF